MKTQSFLNTLNTVLFIALCLTLILTSTACVPAVIGAGALTEAAIAEERGVGVTFGDAGIRSSIHAKVMRYSFKVFNALNFKIREGKVLITGNIDTQEQQLEVLRLVWTVNGVKEVIDETKVGQKGNVGGYARDAWITTQLKSQMLFTRDIQSRNYSIDTVGGIVYIMGVAQSQDELNRVTDLASRTNYVHKVVSYVRIKGPKDGFLDASQPPQGSGAPVVQALPDAEVHVESLPSSSSVSSRIEQDTDAVDLDTPDPHPMTPPQL